MHNQFSLNEKRWHYWFLQFTGWSLLALVNIFMAVLYKRFSQYHILRLLIFIGLGILISHIIIIIFIRAGLFKKRVFFQIAAAALITFCFSIIAACLSFFAYKTFSLLSENEKTTTGLIAILGGTILYCSYFSIWVCFYLIYHYIQAI